MLSRFARLLLAMTSFAPSAFVYGVTLLPRLQKVGVAFMMGAFVAAVGCLWLVEYVRTTSEEEVLQIVHLNSKVSGVPALAASVVLPLLVPMGVDWLSLTVPALLVLVALYRVDAIDLNPVLALVGYSYFTMTAKSGVPYLLIAPLPKLGYSLKDEVVCARVTDRVFLILKEYD